MGDSGDWSQRGQRGLGAMCLAKRIEFVKTLPCFNSHTKSLILSEQHNRQIHVHSPVLGMFNKCGLCKSWKANLTEKSLWVVPCQYIESSKWPVEDKGIVVMSCNTWLERNGVNWSRCQLDWFMISAIVMSSKCWGTGVVTISKSLVSPAQTSCYKHISKPEPTRHRKLRASTSLHYKMPF